MKPIIFSADEVRAQLANRKSQIRRVMRPQPKVIDHIDEGDHVEWSCKKWPDLQVDFLSDLANYAPYEVGDLLYVRETWWDLGHMEKGEWQGRLQEHVVKPRYAATCPNPFPESIGGIVQPTHRSWRETCIGASTWRKRPAIHMPKWAARIWVEVTGVRVEQNDKGVHEWLYDLMRV